ncbi:hypothetical protein CR513_52767, partial [Mucuna pruriens]
MRNGSKSLRNINRHLTKNGRSLRVVFSLTYSYFLHKGVYYLKVRTKTFYSTYFPWVLRRVSLVGGWSK